jgi:gag-polypeptide of LTR copia-type
MANTISFKGDLLVGKSNYIDWVKRANLFLEINGFMPYIDNTEHAPDKSFYYKSNSDGHITKPYSPELAIRYIYKKAEFERNQTKALGAIKSIITQDNVDRFKDKTTAYNLWEAIKATYSETSLETIARYFNKIIEVNYNSFKNADEYTSHIQSSAIYLKDLGHALPEPFIAILLFKGLSSSFDSFSSRKYEEIANELKRNKTSSKRAEGEPLLDISRFISDIISEESRISTNEDSIAYRASNNKPICRHCNKEGHIIDKCWILHPELKNSKSNNSGTKRPLWGPSPIVGESELSGFT